ncbi:hypothetical protein NADFUDRAFT_44115 [Nadsonia fulvescens var. elongata DSM 6958]|uniref:Pentacotripeptide-repeat region of PRORP domain-containing protein n=1 Tax=Nadsonia fulvescens var. elongata DSM 6958 TaxID=857566 RepID=A0A1E3PCP0_9ASCO|nr:hypothetical protein NADFUDRAFT_44115 [Nadsonia fulvescens var. elongata DSM 6958]
MSLLKVITNGSILIRQYSHSLSLILDQSTSIPNWINRKHKLQQIRSQVDNDVLWWSLCDFTKEISSTVAETSPSVIICHIPISRTVNRFINRNFKLKQQSQHPSRMYMSSSAAEKKISYKYRLISLTKSMSTLTDTVTLRLEGSSDNNTIMGLSEKEYKDAQSYFNTSFLSVNQNFNINNVQLRKKAYQLFESNDDNTKPNKLDIKMNPTVISVITPRKSLPPQKQKLINRMIFNYLALNSPHELKRFDLEHLIKTYINKKDLSGLPQFFIDVIHRFYDPKKKIPSTISANFSVLSSKHAVTLLLKRIIQSLPKESQEIDILKFNLWSSTMLLIHGRLDMVQFSVNQRGMAAELTLLADILTECVDPLALIKKIFEQQRSNGMENIQTSTFGDELSSTTLQVLFKRKQYQQVEQLLEYRIGQVSRPAELKIIMASYLKLKKYDRIIEIYESFPEFHYYNTLRNKKLPSSQIKLSSNYQINTDKVCQQIEKLHFLAHCKLKNWNAIYKVLHNNFIRFGESPDLIFFSYLFTLLAEEGKFDFVESLYKQLKSTKSLKDTFTFDLDMALLRNRSLAGDLLGALQTYEGIESVLNKNDTRLDQASLLLLTAMRKNYKLESVIEFIESRLNNGQAVTLEMFTELVVTATKINDQATAKRAFCWMVQYGVKPDRVIYNVLMACYLTNKSYGPAEQLLAKMIQQDGIRPEADTISTFLKYYTLHGKSRKVKHCYDLIQKFEIEVDAQFYSTVLNYYAQENIDPFVDSPGLRKKDEPLYGAEFALIVLKDMLAHGYMASEHEFIAVMKGLIRHDMLDQTKELYDIMISRGIKDSYYTRATQISWLAMSNRISEAKIILKDIIDYQRDRLERVGEGDNSRRNVQTDVVSDYDIKSPFLQHFDNKNYDFLAGDHRLMINADPQLFIPIIQASIKYKSMHHGKDVIKMYEGLISGGNSVEDGRVEGSKYGLSMLKVMMELYGQNKDYGVVGLLWEEVIKIIEKRLLIVNSLPKQEPSQQQLNKDNFRIPPLFAQSINPMLRYKLQEIHHNNEYHLIAPLLKRLKEVGFMINNANMNYAVQLMTLDKLTIEDAFKITESELIRGFAKKRTMLRTKKFVIYKSKEQNNKKPLITRENFKLLLPSKYLTTWSLVHLQNCLLKNNLVTHDNFRLYEFVHNGPAFVQHLANQYPLTSRAIQNMLYFNRDYGIQNISTRHILEAGSTRATGGYFKLKRRTVRRPSHRLKNTLKRVAQLGYMKYDKSDWTSLEEKKKRKHYKVKK